MWTEQDTSSLIKRELDAKEIKHKDVAFPGVVGITHAKI
jgi:hypothetical protein